MVLQKGVLGGAPGMRRLSGQKTRQTPRNARHEEDRPGLGVPTRGTALSPLSQLLCPDNGRVLCLLCPTL